MLIAKKGNISLFRRLTISLTSLFCGYVAQRISPLLSWSLSLYIFLRSILSMWRLVIPLKYQFETKYVYSIIHGSLPYFITYNVQFLTSSYAHFFMAVLDQKWLTWDAMYSIGGQRPNHHHGILSPCKRCIHETHEESCLKAFVRDGIRQYKVSLRRHICLSIIISFDMFFLSCFLFLIFYFGLKFFKCRYVICFI